MDNETLLDPLESSATAELLATVRSIPAIDNHAHASPARRPAPGEGERPDPLGKTPFPYPVRLRVTNPDYAEAWRALYGYAYDDMTDIHAREALHAKLHVMEREGERYPAWVLDQAGIEVALVCLPRLGGGQTAPRFRWAPYADGLLFPFAGEGGFRAMGVALSPGSAPATLDEYLAGVVETQLLQWRAAGAVAVKFAIAYRRPLDIAHVPVAEARALYARRAGDAADKGHPPDALYPPALEDFLVRSVARQAGALGLAVHIHTGVGAEPYFHIGGSNPLLLESMFNDETLRGTRFVMLHGGWPFEREAGVMLLKPNVYADFSAQTFLRTTSALSRVLEEWLAWYPEKVLFGSDAYSEGTPLANWEEKIWLATRTAREALALALTRMVRAGEVTRARAEELARMVLRGNAAELYGLEVC